MITMFIIIDYIIVVANFDFLPFDVEMFSNGNINISGFQIVDKENHEYSLLKVITRPTMCLKSLRNLYPF
jgi:hypothetical protein